MSSSQPATGNPAAPIPAESAGAASGPAKPSGATARHAVLLARIPDVTASPEPDQAPPSDGRILSSGLSAKILIGGGVSLLLIAVMPFLFGTKEEKGHQSGTVAAKAESPMPDGPLSSMAPKWDGKTAYTMKQESVEAAKGQHERAPAEERQDIPAAKGQPQVAALSGTIQTPPGADDANTLGPPEGPVDSPSAAQHDTASPSPSIPSETSAIAARQTVPSSYPRTLAAPPDNRQTAVADRTSRPESQAADRAAGLGDTRPGNVPAYRYPTTDHPQADYAARDWQNDPNARPPVYPHTQPSQPAVYPQTQPIQGTRPAYPNTGYPSYAENYRQRPTYSANPSGLPREADGRNPAASGNYYYSAQPSPRVADLRSAPPRYPVTSPAPTVEPGVARFKGTIEKPTFEKGDDATGPGIY